MYCTICEREAGRRNEKENIKSIPQKLAKINVKNYLKKMVTMCKIVRIQKLICHYAMK